MRMAPWYSCLTMLFAAETLASRAAGTGWSGGGVGGGGGGIQHHKEKQVAPLRTGSTDDSTPCNTITKNGKEDQLAIESMALSRLPVINSTILI